VYIYGIQPVDAYGIAPPDAALDATPTFSPMWWTTTASQPTGRGPAAGLGDRVAAIGAAFLREGAGTEAGGVTGVHPRCPGSPRRLPATAMEFAGTGVELLVVEPLPKTP